MNREQNVDDASPPRPSVTPEQWRVLADIQAQLDKTAELLQQILEKYVPRCDKCQGRGYYTPPLTRMLVRCDVCVRDEVRP
jgi:hypothetical protein